MGFDSQIFPRQKVRLPIAAVAVCVIEDSWPKTMSAWIGFYKKMHDVLTLFFAVVFGEGLLDQHKFLFLAQVIEATTANRPSMWLARRIRSKGILSA